MFISGMRNFRFKKLNTCWPILHLVALRSRNFITDFFLGAASAPKHSVIWNQEIKIESTNEKIGFHQRNHKLYHINH